MHVNRSHPDRGQFISRLKACANAKDLLAAAQLQTEISRDGSLYHDAFIGALFVSLYAKCSCLSKAQEFFDALQARNVVAYNALMTGYGRSGNGSKVLQCFAQMQHEGISPDSVSYVCSVKACGIVRDAKKGQFVHSGITGIGSSATNPIIGSALVDMYAKCGCLAKAQDAFDHLQVRDAISCTTLMAAYVDHGCGEAALMSFSQMKLHGFCPDAVTFVCALKACGIAREIDMGCEIHAEIERKGLLETDPVLGSSLINMYSKCGSLTKGMQVFDRCQRKNIILWNAMMTGYVEHGYSEKTLEFMEQMQLEGLHPDSVSFICNLKACGSIGAVSKGQELHAKVARNGLMEKEQTVACAVVDMYAKCGYAGRAREAFDKLLSQDVVIWTALISAYVENGHGTDALKCFENMQQCNVSPNILTFMYSIKACGDTGAIDKGLKIHAEVERKGLLENDLVLSSNLIAMYLKCGLLPVAQKIFDKLPVRDVALWTPLITGYAELGESENVFCIFDRMQEEGIKPDAISFVSVLNACSRACLLEKSHTYFEAMSRRFGIIPTLEHHSCMVDLLGRSGQLDEAIKTIQKMPICPNQAVWHTILTASFNWGNVCIGRQAFEFARSVNDKNGVTCFTTPYILGGASSDVGAKRNGIMRWKSKGVT